MRLSQRILEDDMKPDVPDSVNRDQRKARLAALLRENLKRRKRQQRSRAAAPATADKTRPAARDPKG